MKETKPKKTKKKDFKFIAYGILNAYGDLWSHESFYTEVEARRKITNFEEKYKQNLRNHKIILAEVTFTPIEIIKKVKKLK